MNKNRVSGRKNIYGLNIEFVCKFWKNFCWKKISGRRKNFWNFRDCFFKKCKVVLFLRLSLKKHGRLRPWPFNHAVNRNPPRRKNRSAKCNGRKGKCVRVLCGGDLWGSKIPPLQTIRSFVAVRILRISGWFRQSFLGLALLCLRGFFPGRRWFLKICSYGSSCRKNFLFQNRLPEIQR